MDSEAAARVYREYIYIFIFNCKCQQIPHEPTILPAVFFLGRYWSCLESCLSLHLIKPPSTRDLLALRLISSMKTFTGKSHFIQRVIIDAETKQKKKTESRGVMYLWPQSSSVRPGYWLINEKTECAKERVKGRLRCGWISKWESAPLTFGWS